MHNPKTYSSADEILHSLQGMQRATAPPFLYQRVMQKITSPTPNVWDRLAMLMARPTVALAFALLLLLLNATVTLLRNNTADTDNTAAANETEYYNATATLYDY